MNNISNEIQRLQRLLILHRYDIYADRRKNRMVYTVSALQRMEERIQQLQRATTATTTATTATSNEQQRATATVAYDERICNHDNN